MQILSCACLGRGRSDPPAVSMPASVQHVARHTGSLPCARGETWPDRGNRGSFNAHSAAHMSAKISISILNAFVNSTGGGGNGAGVVVLSAPVPQLEALVAPPDAVRRLTPDAQRTAVARAVGLSETVFIEAVRTAEDVEGGDGRRRVHMCCT